MFVVTYRVSQKNQCKASGVVRRFFVTFFKGRRVKILYPALPFFVLHAPQRFSMTDASQDQLSQRMFNMRQSRGA
jgi:hypothetical protein